MFWTVRLILGSSFSEIWVPIPMHANTVVFKVVNDSTILAKLRRRKTTHRG